MRWFVLAWLVACDKAPIHAHTIHLETGGLASTGPVTDYVDVDLDRGTLVTHAWGDTGRKPVNRTVDAIQTKELSELAACASTEAKGPIARVTDSYAKLEIVGDTTKPIDVWGLPRAAAPPNGGAVSIEGAKLTAPCAMKLEVRLANLAGWY